MRRKTFQIKKGLHLAVTGITYISIGFILFYIPPSDWLRITGFCILCGYALLSTLLLFFPLKKALLGASGFLALLISFWLQGFDVLTITLILLIVMGGTFLLQ